jgi:pimeloyl-ACP methyl ester carboxylesterase
MVATCFRRTGCVSLAATLAMTATIAVTALPQTSAAAPIELVPAFGAEGLAGPEHAEGAIVWSHGRSTDAEDSLTPTPGYIMAIGVAGWDAFRFNRLRSADALTTSGNALAREAEALKQQGYRRVVLAGQSFGAFISLVAAGQSDAVDAVIGTAPAAFGSRESNPESYGRNATALYELLGSVRRARVALFFFAADIFDPGGRAVAADAILSAHGVPHLVVDQPNRLPTHWASAAPAFAARFAPCLAAFAEQDGARGALDCRKLTPTLRVAALP